jgi:Ni/Co efflux regulator RcnB
VSELQRLAKPPRGQMWVGYTSQWVQYDSTQGNQNFTAKVPFGL